MTNNTVELNIATTNTSKATKDVKSLREQIKDLKNEMAGLTQGTDEYNQAAAQLGDLMHQQSEISEAAKLATNDYGQTLSNITSISAGVVGSISAMNGVLNLVGASSDEATEAMRKIQSLMSIVQGLNQLDAADKALKGLWTRIKNATTAKKEDTQETIRNSQAETQNAAASTVAAKAKKQEAVASGVAAKANGVLSLSFKSLKKAIMSFMASNPFTLIIMAVTTVIGLVSSLISKQKELNKQIEKEAENFRNAADARALAEASGGPSLDNTNLRLTGEAERRTAAGSRRLRPDSEEDKKAKEDLAKYREQLNELEKADKKYSDRYAKIYKDLYFDQKKRLNELYHYWVHEQSRYANWSQETDLENRQKMLEHWQQYGEEIDKLLIQMGSNYYEYQQYLTDKAKEEQAKRDKNAEDSANDYLKKIKEEFDLKVIEIERAYKNHEIDTQEYYKRLIDAHTEYLEKYKKSKKKEAVTVAQEEDAITDIQRKAASERIEDAYKEAVKMAEIRDSKRPRVETNYDEMENDAKRLLYTQRYYEQQGELLDAWWFRKFRLIEQYNQRELEIEREFNMYVKGLAMQRYDDEEEVLKGNRDLELQRVEDIYAAGKVKLDELKAENLISEDDYKQQMIDLTQEREESIFAIELEYHEAWQELQNSRVDTEMEINQQLYEIEKEAAERQRELAKTYINAFSTVVSSIGNLMGSLQGYYEEGSKQYEALQEAQIVMSTITGTLAAWMSGIEAAPAPWNLAIAAAMSGIAMAQGIMAIDQLHKKKLGGLSSGASNAPSTSAYQTFVSETGADLQGDIQDQRVVVLEQDITDTVNRVNVVESESTF